MNLREKWACEEKAPDIAKPQHQRLSGRHKIKEDRKRWEQTLHVTVEDCGDPDVSLSPSLQRGLWCSGMALCKKLT